LASVSADIALASLHAWNHATSLPLETKRRKEPFIFSRLEISHRTRNEIYLELLLKTLLNGLLRVLSLTHLLQRLRSNMCSQLLYSIESISRRHEMVVIDQFDEWFYFTSLRDSLLTHSCSDFPGVTLNSGNESMSKRMYFCSIVVWFKDHCFTPCIAATSNECDFSRFQD